MTRFKRAPASEPISRRNFAPVAWAALGLAERGQQVVAGAHEQSSAGKKSERVERLFGAR